MNINITKNDLTDSEINRLAQETKKSIHIGFIHSHVWKNFSYILVARNKHQLLGACVLIGLGNWIKIGPIIVLEQYQKRGIGKKLLTEAIKKFISKNLYIGSSHIGVKKIVSSLGFQEVSFLKLDQEIKKYLISYFWQRNSLEYILDALKKRLKSKRGKYCFFVKHRT